VPYACSICEQESTRICLFCTKDACGIHICDRCGCCSDCCQCDVPLEETAHVPSAASAEAAAQPVPEAHDAMPELAVPAELLSLTEENLQPAPPSEPLAASEAHPLTSEESAAEPWETPEG
jgi:hypothetical protein